MFIEQSAGRRRVVRLAFVLAAVVPCGLLVATAWWRHSGGAREALEREASALLGVAVEVGAVRHLRPGVVRLADVGIGGREAAAAVRLADVEIETTATEVRMRLPRLECSPAAAGQLVALAGGWLREPARFGRAWVVDVAEVVWLTADGGRIGDASGWHVECAEAGGARGVRARRSHPSADEVRVQVAGAEVAIEGRLDAALPVPIVAALFGDDAAWAAGCGPQATVRGRVELERTSGRWSGSWTGGVEGLDLASVATARPRQLSGEASVEIDRFVVANGRLAACDATLRGRGGSLSQELLDDLVGQLGCRPGAAYRALGGDRRRVFDRLACRIQFDGATLAIRAVEGVGLVETHGLVMIEPPAGPIPALRVAWLMAPEGRPAVPASATSAWLMSVLPERSGAPAGF